MFQPQGGSLVYNLTNFHSFSIILPILLHNIPNVTWITTSFNCKYPSMHVHTSHRCYGCPPFTLCPWQWIHKHPWCNSQHFCCHCKRCWLPCGTKTTTHIFFNHVSFLLSTSRHCVHQKWNSHLSWCCHCRSNTIGFTSSTLRNTRICYLQNNLNQIKELLWLTPH